MTTIELHFLANRYHGTAWGRHVNEGVPEWPPSPYRLLRALYDAWKRKCDDLSEAEVQEVFAALASKSPTFLLPKAVSAHTRSYLNSNTEDASDKSLIFDAFLAVNPKASCILKWDVALEEDQRRTLARLLSSLNYLGRSESWVEARLLQETTAVEEDNRYDCKPADGGGSGDLTYVACAVAPSEYRAKEPWLHALAYSSSRLLKEKLSGPPAMQYIPYTMEPDAVTTWLPKRPAKQDRHLSAAVLELHGRVLPMATDTVRMAERVRGRLMRHFERRGQAIPTIVHGKDENGNPLREKHSHLFILPRSNLRGRIDHVLLFTTHKSGFEADVADAIANVRQIVWIEDIKVTAAWMGSAEDLKVRPKTRQVKSSTPFVTVRHWRKGRGTESEFLEEEIRRECLNHGLPVPISINKVDRVGQFSALQFRRNREGDPSRAGFGFKLMFDKDVQAPLSLGYGCHFGLGQFEEA